MVNTRGLLRLIRWVCLGVEAFEDLGFFLKETIEGMHECNLGLYSQRFLFLELVLLLEFFLELSFFLEKF